MFGSMDPRSFAHAQFGIPSPTGQASAAGNPFAMPQPTYAAPPEPLQPPPGTSVPYGSGAPPGASGIADFGRLTAITPPGTRLPSPAPPPRSRAPGRSSSVPAGARARTNSREQKRREQLAEEPVDADKLRDWVTRLISCETACRNSAAIVSNMEKKISCRDSCGQA